MSNLPCSHLSQALADQFGTLATAVPDPQGGNAAVAVVVRPPPGTDDPPVAECSVLLIRRATSPRDPWSGQMALPGGRMDPADPTLVATAVRETREETGLELDPVHGLAGRLPAVSPMSVHVPSLTIWPFVFHVAPGVRARVASPEVAAVHWFGAGSLSDPTNRYRPLDTFAGETDLVPSVRIDDQVVWGLTSRILNTFLQTSTIRSATCV